MICEFCGSTAADVQVREEVDYEHASTAQCGWCFKMGMNTTRCAHVWRLFSHHFEGDRTKTTDIRKFFKEYLPLYLRVSGEFEY